jgi:hypothetical protein
MAHRIRKVQLTILCNTTNNTVPAVAPTAKFNGIFRGIKIKTPAVIDNSGTLAVTVKDADGDTLYTKSAIAQNTTNTEFQDSNHIQHSEPLTGTYTINPLFSATQAEVQTVIVTIFYEAFIDTP